MAEEPGDGGRWLTYSEAAKVTGELPDKLRAMVRRGRLQARRPDQSNDGKARVLVPPHMIRAGQGDGLVDAMATGQAGDHAESQGEAEPVAVLREELAEARERAAHAEGRAGALAEQIVGMAAAIAKAEARAERLEADLADVRKRAEAELAEARKPALLRLIEALRRR
jgi:hypothetical protein